MVEFALVLTPLVLLVVGIVQFGLLLSGNVTLTNAAREGARAGTVYRYEVGLSRDTNDKNRCTAVVTAITQSLGVLRSTSPNYSVASECPNGSGEVWVNGDVTITYARPTTPAVQVSDTREGYTITVDVTYRQDIIVPIVGALLSTDGSGRFVQRATVTMIVN